MTEIITGWAKDGTPVTKLVDGVEYNRGVKEWLPDGSAGMMTDWVESNPIEHKVWQQCDYCKRWSSFKLLERTIHEGNNYPGKEPLFVEVTQKSGKTYWYVASIRFCDKCEDE